MSADGLIIHLRTLWTKKETESLLVHHCRYLNCQTQCQPIEYLRSVYCTNHRANIQYNHQTPLITKCNYLTMPASRLTTRLTLCIRQVVGKAQLCFWLHRMRLNDECRQLTGWWNTESEFQLLVWTRNTGIILYMIIKDSNITAQNTQLYFTRGEHRQS